MSLYHILYGALVAAATAACVAFLQQWDVIFYLAVVTLFYCGIWAITQASSLEKESYTRFMEAEALREQVKQQRAQTPSRSLFS